MFKHTLICASLAVALTAAAQDQTMYLVKNDRVVAKYAVDAVDYIAFELPDNVSRDNVWLTIDNVGKNTVTYTVNTSGSDIGYGHNLLSYWDVNYNSLDMLGEMYDDLDEDAKVSILQYTLSMNAFLGVGTAKYTQNDFEQYSNYSEANRFSVQPGTKYFLCVWEADPVTSEPLETFVYDTLTTEAPDEVNLGLDVTMDEVTIYGMALNFTGNDDVLYVRTAWGMKSAMESYETVYGRDFLMGTFGQNWSLEFLAGTGDLQPGVANATWPVYDSGEYVMYVDAYSKKGNVQRAKYIFEYEDASVGDAPTITVLNRDKGDGRVSVNFEIIPSNVEEAYVRLLSENTVDDRLNMGYTYPELAKGGDAIDITNEINRLGEYTYTNNEVPEEWNALLIYAQGKEGGETTLRINFYPDSDTEWSVYDPKHAPGKVPAVKRLRRAGVPAIPRGVN